MFTIHPLLINSFTISRTEPSHFRRPIIMTRALLSIANRPMACVLPCALLAHEAGSYRGNDWSMNQSVISKLLPSKSQGSSFETSFNSPSGGGF